MGISTALIVSMSFAALFAALMMIEQKNRKIAGIAQLVEHHVANVDVAGSNPVSRSMGDQLSWESICFARRRSRVRASYPPFWTLSSVGQSTRLITGWSWVQVPEGPL